MIRRWRVQPDSQENTADGAVYAVSQEALAVALMDAATMLHRAGGVIQVVVERYPTGMPGEMVTTGAVVEWRHRTDARPEPEPQTQQPVSMPEEEVRERMQVAVEPPPEDDPTQYRGGEFVDDIGDGLDPNALPAEDDSEVEAGV